MAFKPIIDRLWSLTGFVNMFLIDAPDGLILIDTGLPGSEGKVTDRLRTLGRSPGDLKHIVLTHAHPDHIGSAAALQRLSCARTYIGTADAPIAETGGPFRPMTPAPGLLPKILAPLVANPDRRVPPVQIDERISDGDVLPLAGGLEAIATPGHCAGQMSLLWRERGVLFAGDACTHLFRLGPPIAYENRAEGEQSQRKLAGRTFDVACFGHGSTMVSGASRQFREKWG